MRSFSAVASVLLGGSMILTSNLCLAGQFTQVSSQTLEKTTSSWDGAEYVAYPQGKPELSILKITVPPHTTLGWHTHPVPNAAYVLSGYLTVEKKSGGAKKIIHAGETLAETVGTVHRGYTGDEPVTLIVFYAGAKGLPLSQAAK